MAWRQLERTELVQEDDVMYYGSESPPQHHAIPSVKNTIPKVGHPSYCHGANWHLYTPMALRSLWGTPVSFWRWENGVSSGRKLNWNAAASAPLPLPE